MELNKIYNEDCLDTMGKMPDNFVDLVVTSPPYDNLRTYNGFNFEFEKIAKELYRVVKQGGVVVWIVNDATIDGSETGTSFRQAKPNMSFGTKDNCTSARRNANGEFKQKKREFNNPTCKRNNWWLYCPQPQEGSEFHPAVFPEQLVAGHIISWSNEGDIVFDPFAGSGTTAKMSVVYNRKYIGSEISKEYAEKAIQRIKNEEKQMKLF